MDATIEKQNEGLKELKKAVEDMREEKGTGRIQQPRQGEGRTQSGARRHSKKLLRIGGWSPYGSPIESRIDKEEATELQNKISSLCTRQQRAEWRWDRPWLTNFQLILYIDFASDTNDVFNARAEIQKIIDTSSTTVRGCKIEVRVEPGQERKKWLTTYFNHARALESATGSQLEQRGRNTPLGIARHVDSAYGLAGRSNREGQQGEQHLRVRRHRARKVRPDRK